VKAKFLDIAIMSTGLSYEVRVLHAAADGIGPALILSAPKGAAQYLVNVPEGFARLALEHKLRPSARLSCVMLTSLLPQSAVRISTFQFAPNFLGPGLDLCTSCHGDTE
jgi:hypothetical protein